MKKGIFYLSLIILMVVSCSKPDCDNPLDCLPEVTRTGKDTFGCLVEGIIFKPSGTGIGASGLDAYYSNTGEIESLSISAINKKQNNGVNLVIQDNIESGTTYELGNRIEDSYALFNDGSSYATFEASSGTITINYFDRENGIISGVFSFKAQNESGEIVEVTEGRFDLDL